MKALNIIFAIVFILTCAEASAHGDNGESSGQEEYARQDEAAEDIFAGYFDIRTGCGEGEEVTGRIHLERNKDILHSPVPEGWHFEITGQPAENLFSIRTWRDLSGRVLGIFSVAEGKHTGSVERPYPMEMALMDGEDVLGRFSVEIHIEEQTLWETLYERYVPIALETGRMYGRMRFSDSRTAELIGELEETGGRFRGLRCYDAKPQDYVGDFGHDDEFLPTGTIEYDWEKVVNMIGELGYSYAKSAIYGPEGDPEKRKRLRDALYHAILTYASSVPVEGTDMMTDGKPIGNCTGDGFSLLQAHGLSGIQIPTHQWTLTDGLTVPALVLMPDLMDGMSRGDTLCLQVHDALIRYMQIFFSEIKSRRSIDDPDGRWGEIRDTLHSHGAWADANLGHRSRTLLALPLIWADYNRPVTYVQYWYSSYYDDPPFEGFSFSPGWSPHGVIDDVRYWVSRCGIPTHEYAQSGFQPDGTISHHTGHGTDMAMVAYGFEWLTSSNTGYLYLKDTPFRLPDQCYQFEADRLAQIYPRLFYRQRMDFLAAGRSFLDDMKKFVTVRYAGAVESLMDARSEDTSIEGAEKLKEICRQLNDDSFEYSGTDAYWVQEYLVHRRGENEKPFFASLKLKSERTVGAEDFNRKTRRSWYAGYGILPVKVYGDEYSDKVLRNFDWHALPGLTEEWRTDAMPLGHSQASLPGANRTAGVLSDGMTGMGIYHHLPKEEYSSATGFKTYHFMESMIISTGTGIRRLREGQGQEIVTFIDQSELRTPLSWSIGGKVQTLMPGEDTVVRAVTGRPFWLHHGKKGYLVFPEGRSTLIIKTGAEVNVTDLDAATGMENFIIALSHGPLKKDGPRCGSYRYVQIPNAEAEDMDRLLKETAADLEFSEKPGAAHAVCSKSLGIWQFAFFKPGKISAGGISVSSCDTAQIMLRDAGDRWILSAGNPAPDGRKRTLKFRTDAPLAPGTYRYMTAGLYPLEGETVSVSPCEGGREITVDLPDFEDAARYGYSSDLYSASPIVFQIPKTPLPKL